MNRTTEYRYNVEGLLEELVCHNGETAQVTRWEYGVERYGMDDALGVARADLVKAKVYPDGGGDRVEYTYNRLGDVVGLKDQNGTVHTYKYDSMGRMTADTATVSEGSAVDGTIKRIGVSFTSRGEVLTVTSYNGIEPSLSISNWAGYSYNGFGQVTQEAQAHGGGPSGQTIFYEYEDAAGLSNSTRLKRMQYPSGRQLDYLYGGVLNDALSRVQKIKDVAPNQDVVTYGWLGAGVPVKTRYGVVDVEMTVVAQGTEGSGDAGDRYTALDRFGRLQTARWVKGTSDWERVDYGFDRAGNITWRRNPLAPPEHLVDEHYTYDDLYQVTGLNRGRINQNRTAIGGVPNWKEGWRYDEMGNWLEYETAKSGTSTLEQSRSYNKGNELLFIDESNATVAHDPAGNMTRMPKVTDWEEGQELRWDAWNRLVGITENHGETEVANYRYDGLNRRIRKDVNGNLTHFYYTTSWQVAEQWWQVGGDSEVEKAFIWGVKSLDDLVLRYTIGSGDIIATHWSINDGKNVTAVTDDEEVVERYAYSGFGTTEVFDADFAPRLDNESDYTWETRFCGYRFDSESELYQVRFRYYHSQLGRWLNMDPIEEKGGYNLIAAVGNQPINYNDEFGLAFYLDQDHHWFPQSARFQGRLKQLCGGFDIDQFTTTYDGDVVGTSHWWITNAAKYNLLFENLLSTANDCCDLLRGVKNLMIGLNQMVNGINPDLAGPALPPLHRHLDKSKTSTNKDFLQLLALWCDPRKRSPACAQVGASSPAQISDAKIRLENLEGEREAVAARWGYSYDAIRNGQTGASTVPSGVPTPSSSPARNPYSPASPAVTAPRLAR